MKIKFTIVGILIGIGLGYIYTLLNPNEVIKEVTEIKYRYVTNTVYLDTPPKIIGTVLPKDTMYIPADTVELIERYRKLWTSYYSRHFGLLCIKYTGNKKYYR